MAAFAGKNSVVSLYDALLDAFGRIRTSQPVTLFDSQLEYGLARLLWQTSLTGSASATHQPTDATVLLRTTASKGDRAIRQTRQYFRYQPGKAQLILFTGNFHTAVEGAVKRAGYYDDQNGVFFQRTATNNSWVLRRNGVDQEAKQHAWNVDKMGSPGEPVSNWNLNPAYANIYWIALEWLGVGSVLCGQFFDAKPYVAHEFKHAGSVLTTYMRTANLPVRYEVENLEAAGSATNDLTQICCAVISEGGFEEGRQYAFSDVRGNAGLSVTNTEVPVFSIRPSALFNGIVNRATILPTGVEVMSLLKSAIFRVRYGATLTGASWTAFNADDSVVDVDRSANAVSGGLVIRTIPIPAASQGNARSPGGRGASLAARLPLTLNIAGAHPTTPYTDSLTLTAISAEGTDAASVYGGFSWEELR